jgi:hypothetical protein
MPEERYKNLFTAIGNYFFHQQPNCVIFCKDKQKLFYNRVVGGKKTNPEVKTFGFSIILVITNRAY